ncbi:amidohydrolase family protein [Roseomonas chloroacetimidivorans]|uniref:amidohydrolase family protein n=1 Tax=Roseomonas chloroacetimidivorans TaxID=1766656 RepID=UPI003C763B61
MRYIDAFNHFFPKRLWDRMLASEGQARNIGTRMRNIPAIYDLDVRFKVMDRFSHHDYTQVISLGMPPLDQLGGPDVTPELARLGNDGMAELVQQHPDRFAGYVASLPMNAPEAATQEAERALRNGANGLQIHSHVDGLPLDDERFFPIFEVAARSGKPVLLHPTRGNEMPDYRSEDRSKYEIWWTFGWPYETSAAMARLVFSGLMDRLPELKVMAHHLGAMIPYFEGRVGPGWDLLGTRTTDEDLKPVLQQLRKRPFEYFKHDFYADSATFGSRAAMVCGLEFYGADKVLFASDCPFDPEKGPGYIRETIAVLESLELSPEDRDKICFRNAEKLFGLTPR